MLAMPIPDVSGALRFNSIDYDCRMSSHNRKQRRAARARDRGGEQEVRSLGSPIREQIDRLGSLGGFANHVSMALTGLPTSTSGMLASMVFAKCCAHARSIGAIALQSSMFDHHAIMALARMIMEASTMIAYLLDPVPDEEWEFRHTLLRLHDSVGRLKLMRGFGMSADDIRVGRDELKAQIEASPTFHKLSDERKKRVASGEEMFVVGMRNVATRMMGWDETQFNGVYAYFSAHTHSAPMSFSRMADHGIDYFHPSDTQFEIPALSIEVAMACLRRSMLRMLEGHPAKIAEFHPKLLAEAYEDDAGCPFFSKPLQAG